MVTVRSTWLLGESLRLSAKVVELITKTKLERDDPKSSRSSAGRVSFRGVSSATSETGSWSVLSLTEYAQGCISKRIHAPLDRFAIPLRRDPF
jgi:hypothetical protein